VILDERVRAELSSKTRFNDVRLLDETDSTNRVALDAAAGGAGEGLVVSADRQTSGRGRLDRKWEAERGAGLLASVLLRPRDLAVGRWHLLTEAAGLAAQDACASVAGVRPDLKWPNDLLIGDRKLAGILAEVPGNGESRGSVVIGMGLNVHSAPRGAAFLDEASGRRVDRGELLVAWLTRLDSLLDRWDTVASLYRNRCGTVGQRVQVEQLHGVTIVGRAEGIDDDGQLVVVTDAGSVVTVGVGDVTHLRTPAR
jgi:BirA family biotin operon repressor/biotin-[acetyl-CoA-carboxylase] ligase